MLTRCIQSGEKCSFISHLASYPFNKYKFLIQILSSSVKVILFIYITTVVCQGAWLPWKPCSWYSTRTKLIELNQSATEWRCFAWKIIKGELILMNLMQTCLRGAVFLRPSEHIKFNDEIKGNPFEFPAYGLIPRTHGPFNIYSAQRIDLFAWCVTLSRLLVGFRTHFKSLHFLSVYTSWFAWVQSWTGV